MTLQILIDIVFIFIPIVMLWNVQIKRSTKHGIWGVLGLGAL